MELETDPISSWSQLAAWLLSSQTLPIHVNKGLQPTNTCAEVCILCRICLLWQRVALDFAKLCNNCSMSVFHVHFEYIWKTDGFTELPHPISSFKGEKQWAMGLECSPREQTKWKEHSGIGELFLEDFKFLTDAWKAIQWILSIGPFHKPYGFVRGANYLWASVAKRVCFTDVLFIWVVKNTKVLKKTARMSFNWIPDHRS